MDKLAISSSPEKTKKKKKPDVSVQIPAVSEEKSATEGAAAEGASSSGGGNANEKNESATTKTRTVTKPPSPARQMDKMDALLSPRTNVEPSSSTKENSVKTIDELMVEENEADVELPYDKNDSVAFFDLDHTVVDTNSSWLWVQHEVNQGRVGAHMVLTAIYWFGRYALGYGAGAERAGADAAETYKGVHADKLRGDVESFFNEEMKHRIRPGCVPVLKAHKRRSQRVIMCTSTWQHPAETAAKMFGFETEADDVICSHMQVTEDGVLNGKLAKIAYGDEKYERTKEWAVKNNVDLKKCYFYTDSYSDVKLMEHVGYPVAVNPDPRLLKHAESRGWEIVDWGVAPQRAKKPRYHYGCLNGARQSYA